MEKEETLKENFRFFEGLASELRAIIFSHCSRRDRMALGRTDSQFALLLHDLEERKIRPPPNSCIATPGYRTFVLTRKGEIYTVETGVEFNNKSGFFCTASHLIKVKGPRGARFVRMATNGERFVALSQDGVLYSGGRPSSEWPVRGDRDSRLTLEKIQGLDAVQFVQVESAYPYTLALSNTGELYISGSGPPNRRGQGDTQNRFILTKVKALEDVQFVGAAGNSRCIFALSKDGELYTCDMDTRGQLEQGDLKKKYTLTKLQGLEGIQFVQVVASTNHFIALSVTGGVYTYGKGLEGQLGQGDFKDRSTFTQVKDLEGIRFVEAAAGPCHTVILSVTGKVYTCGQGSSGQLGHGDTQNRFTFTPVKGLADIVHVAAGNHHTFALDKKGQLFAFGSNEDGQCGLPFWEFTGWRLIFRRFLNYFITLRELNVYLRRKKVKWFREGELGERHFTLSPALKRGLERKLAFPGEQWALFGLFREMGQNILKGFQWLLQHVGALSFGFQKKPKLSENPRPSSTSSQTEILSSGQESEPSEKETRVEGKIEEEKKTETASSKQGPLILSEGIGQAGAVDTSFKPLDSDSKNEEEKALTSLSQGILGGRGKRNANF